MNFLLLIRKSDELGINFWLRLLALALSGSLLFLTAYYFVVVNRDTTPKQTQIKFTTTFDTEKQKADAAIAAQVKSAISQTMRLHAYSIGVEYREGKVTLFGEVPTVMDKEFAANLAREASGGKQLENNIAVIASAASPNANGEKTNSPEKIAELELQASLYELLQAAPLLQQQDIKLKVQNRAVAISGRVATEQQKLQTEQIIRNAAKVTNVENLLRVGN